MPRMRMRNPARGRDLGSPSSALEVVELAGRAEGVRDRRLELARRREDRTPASRAPMSGPRRGWRRPAARPAWRCRGGLAQRCRVRSPGDTYSFFASIEPSRQGSALVRSVAWAGVPADFPSRRCSRRHRTAASTSAVAGRNAIDAQASLGPSVAAVARRRPPDAGEASAPHSRGGVPARQVSGGDFAHRGQAYFRCRRRLRRPVRISEEVEHRFRPKWNIDFGGSGTAIPGSGTRISGCGTSIPGEVERWFRSRERSSVA